MKSIRLHGPQEISGQNPSAARRFFSSVESGVEGLLRSFGKAGVYTLTIGSALLPLKCGETTLIGASSPDSSVSASQDTAERSVDASSEATKNDTKPVSPDNVSSPDVNVFTDTAKKPVDASQAEATKNDTKPVSSDGVSSHDMLVPTDTVDGKADSKGDTVIPVDVFQDDATMFVPIDTTENSIDVPKATNENVITTSTCDQDGDGIITDNFKNYYFLIAIRNALGKKFNADITLQDVLKTTSLNLSSSGLQSLPNILGIECFTELTVLDLSINSEISDITPLAGLTKLTYLDLSFTGISNNLAPLKNLINLTTLYLFASGISDVTSLAGLTKLQDLVLSSNNLSDLTPLKDFTNLIYVDFWDNMISDVTPLAGLIKLQELTIGNQKGSEVVSDVTALAGLINLTRLELPNNEISDITPLAGLTNLTHLTLEGNKISDVTPLAALTKLEFLYLDNNQISDVTSFTGLINLWFLELRFNLLYDLTPLLNNPGINFGDKACILGNPNVPQSQIKALVNKGVNVICSPSY